MSGFLHSCTHPEHWAQVGCHCHAAQQQQRKQIWTYLVTTFLRTKLRVGLGRVRHTIGFKSDLGGARMGMSQCTLVLLLLSASSGGALRPSQSSLIRWADQLKVNILGALGRVQRRSGTLDSARRHVRPLSTHAADQMHDGSRQRRRRRHRRRLLSGGGGGNLWEGREPSVAPSWLSSDRQRGLQRWLGQEAAASKPSTCPEGCTKKGTCNEELGRCIRLVIT